MDFAVRMKSFDMLIKFLKHDLQNIAIAETGYAISENGSSVPLARRSPESQGVPSQKIQRFVKDISDAPDISAHSVVILRHGHVIAQASWAPYRLDHPHMLYSMSKSVTGTAIGIAEQEGFLSLDERIADIFRDKISAAQSLLLRQITIRHLLTMSSGMRFNEPGSALSDDWVKTFLNSIPRFEPGSAFEYNSLNTYMLSAVLRKKTGMGLVEYLTPRLFEPLGIRNTKWEVCPKGIEKGGWGLSLTAEDAAKLGQLYLNKGVWNGRRVLSAGWVTEATKQQIRTPSGECRHGYGYQIWLYDSEGSYQFNGAFGQYVIVLPKADVVIALMSGSDKLFSGSPLLGIINEFMQGLSDIPLAEDPDAESRLKEELDSLTFRSYAGIRNGTTDAGLLEDIAKRLDGREYRLHSNIGGAFPFILQCVHGNMTQGLYMVRFVRTDEGLRIDLYEGNDRNSLTFCEEIAYSSFTVKGETQAAGVQSQWRMDEDGTIVLFAAASFIETPNTRLFTFVLSGDSITVRFGESPGVGSAVAMFCEILGYTQMEYYRKLIPALREERLHKRIREIAAPTAEGERIRSRS